MFSLINRNIKIIHLDIKVEKIIHRDKDIWLVKIIKDVREVEKDNILKNRNMVEYNSSRNNIF